MTSATSMKPNPRPASRPLTLSLLITGVLLLTACTVSAPPAPESTAVSGLPASADPTPGSTGQATAATPPTQAPGQEGGPPAAEADVARIAGAVEAGLQTLADSQASVTRNQVRAAIEQGFGAAGAAPESVEVSIDRTPTGLDVDAIHGAGLIGGSCVVGEVREGAVAVTVLPVLATGLCFVGDQR